MPPTVTRQPMPDAIGSGCTLNTTLLNAIIGAANEFGRNLHRVNNGQITMSRAIIGSLTRGVTNSLAATAAVAVTSDLSTQDGWRIAAVATATTSFAFLLSGVLKSVGRNGCVEENY